MSDAPQLPTFDRVVSWRELKTTCCAENARDIRLKTATVVHRFSHVFSFDHRVCVCGFVVFLRQHRVRCGRCWRVAAAAVAGGRFSAACGCVHRACCRAHMRCGDGCRFVWLLPPAVWRASTCQSARTIRSAVSSKGQFLAPFALRRLRLAVAQTLQPSLLRQSRNRSQRLLQQTIEHRRQ